MKDKLEQMLDAVGDAQKALILVHNDPDPDAIAGAMGLSYLLSELRRIQCRITYQGIIGRAENKALARYLGCPLHRLSPSDLASKDPLALVDTQPGAGNNALPAGSMVSIVIDHHPLRQATAEAVFADVRPEIGATATMLTQYLRAADLEPPPSLATALFYGIKTDTLALARGASPADVRAFYDLQPRIDVEALAEIEHAQVPIDYFKKLNAALLSARLYAGVVVTYLGAMQRPDIAAEMADLLMRLEHAVWVLSMGTYEDRLILSLRTRSQAGGAGQIVQEIVGDQGTAGGHGRMAAGHVPLMGEDPALLAARLGERALRLLGIDGTTAGTPLMG